MGEKITRFEDFIAWQKARELTALIYRTTASGNFAKDFGLRDQIRRAAVSIMSNIAEGFERGRPTEFKQFLSIAKGSCAELRAQLYIALDAGYLDKPTFTQLFTLAEETGRIVGGLRLAAERRANATHHPSLITHNSEDHHG
jgi:four helix bundle protein